MIEPSQRCIDLIKEFEGCRLKAYQDLKGIWTVGYGSTQGGIGPDTIWTQAQADQQLLDRASTFARLISAKVTSVLTQNQADAVISLVYNIGINAFKDSTLCKLLNRHDFYGAAQEFTKWDHCNGQEVPGLLRRRQAEQALFLSSYT